MTDHMISACTMNTDREVSLYLSSWRVSIKSAGSCRSILRNCQKTSMELVGQDENGDKSGDNVCREPGAGFWSVFGGEGARTRDRRPDLAPAQPPLACPLAPTGGDALTS